MGFECSIQEEMPILKDNKNRNAKKNAKFKATMIGSVPALPNNSRHKENDDDSTFLESLKKCT